MKMIFRTLALLAGSATLALAGGKGWLTDFDAAKKQAAKEDKTILIDFTGSDWCGWCIKLDKEVFSKKAFKKYAEEKFVLLEVDFPQDKDKLSEKQREENEKLAKKFGIQGFPTILLTDAKGRKFAQTGYQEGGPEAYTKHLDELLEKKDLD